MQLETRPTLIKTPEEVHNNAENGAYIHGLVL
jgi:hypothetical protein